MLMKSFEDRVFKSAAPQSITHIIRPDLDTKDPALRIILDQVAEEFQVAPPLTIHMSDPALLAGLWHATREIYVVNPSTRTIREAVAGAISAVNSCPYCVAVHDGMFAAGGGDDASDIIKAARAWASNTLNPDQQAPQKLAQDLPSEDITQIYGTAMLYHYLNRMVSVFLSDSPVNLPGMTTGPGKKLAKAMFSIMGKRIIRVDAPPGQSAVIATGDLRPELPAQFNWARDTATIADALAHFASAIEAAGLEAVPDEVRALTLAHLSRWKGEQSPLSRAWIEDEIAPLSDAMKPAARLCLLTIRAPWQVDDALIAEFRRTSPGDRPLIQTTAWAAFRAADHISSWFAPLALPDGLA